MLAHRGGHDNLTATRFVVARMFATRAEAHHARVSTTVLIVDDHDDFRSAARAVLEADGYVVVAEAGDGGSGVRLAAELGPSLVLLDIGLPDQDGFAVADKLARLAEPPDVVLISSRDRAAYGRRIDAAPVRGFLSKRQLSGRALTDLLA